MIARGWLRYAFAALTLPLLLAPAAFIFTAGKDVRIVTKIAPATAPKDAAGLTTLLGKPTQMIPGKDINASLDGTQCAVFSFADGVALVCR